MFAFFTTVNACGNAKSDELQLPVPSAAQYNLSILYRYGEGVEKDIDLADTWRMRAAQNGFKLAIEEIHKEVGIE